MSAAAARHSPVTCESGDSDASGLRGSDNDPEAPSAELLFRRGNLQLADGRPEAAIREYTRALEIRADFAEAWTNRGIARERLGDLAGAIADHTKAISVAPDLAIAYNNRANVLFKNNDAPAAIADYDRAIGSAPHSRRLFTTGGVSST